jgi:hydroxymethylglutaryl-CoA lyase
MNRPEVELRETVLSDGLVGAALAPPAELRAQLVDLLSDAGLPYIEVAALDVREGTEAPRDPEALRCAQVLPERAEKTFAGMVRRYEVYPLFRQTALDAISIRLGARNVCVGPGWELSDAALAVDRMELWMPEFLHGGYRARAVLVDGLQTLAQDDGELDRLIEALLEEGVEEICIGDAVGDVPPNTIRRAAKRWIAHFGVEKVGLKPGDGLGRGLVQLCAGYDGGVRRFDVALAGIGTAGPQGGCGPALATEDAVALLADEGVSTGVDLRQLLRCSRIACERLGAGGRSRYAAACDREGRPTW